jgi:uncharacterized repeat protein (TIGR01451 family)
MTRKIVGTLVVLVLFVSSGYCQSFMRSGNNADTPTGTVFTANITFETLDYKANGVSATTTTPVNVLSVTTVSEYGFSYSQDNPDQAVAPGDVVVISYNVTNEGNADDTYDIKSFFILGGGGANWTAEITVEALYTQALTVDTLSTSSEPVSDNDDAAFQYTITVANTQTDAPDGSYLTIYSTVESQAAPAGPFANGAGSDFNNYYYTGGNKFEYGGTSEAFDDATYTISAPSVEVTRTSNVDSPEEYQANGGATTDPVPGAVITYTITATNSGSSTAKDCILIDRIPEYYATNKTNLSHINATGDRGYVTLTPPQGNATTWEVYYSTSDTPPSTVHGGAGWSYLTTLGTSTASWPAFSEGLCNPTDHATEFTAKWIKFETGTFEGTRVFVWGATVR